MQVAQNFIDGFNDNPNHPYDTYIAVATSNDDDNWTCDNNNPGTLSANWYNAGSAWGSLFQSGGIQSRSKVIPVSGNDIEVFFDSSNGWGACGLGTLRWFDGFEGAVVASNYNFGDNPNVEDPGRWTTQQVYDVVYGRSSAWAYPQVYCTNLLYSKGWPSIRAVNYLKFLGVTSDGGQSQMCANYGQGGGPWSLTWQQSWSELDTTMTNAGYPNTVASTSIYYYALGR